MAPLMQRRTGLPSTSPDFTPDQRQTLAHVTNISDFTTAAADPFLKGYLDWYLQHLQTRLEKPKPGNLVDDALRPHLTNTSEVDQGLEHILSLVTGALVDVNGDHSMRCVYERVLLGVQPNVQPPNPTDDDDDDATDGEDDGDEPQENLSNAASTPKANLTEDVKKLEQCLPAIFHVIGQVTMLYTTPPLSAAGAYSPSTRALQLSLPDPSDPTKTLRSRIITRTTFQLPEDMDTPPRLKTLLSAFGRLLPPWEGNLNPNSLRFGDTLFSGNLSYEAMLRTAGIKIAWVDSFPLHLEFDARTVTLKVFRFPSFCAMLAHPLSANSQFFDILLSDDMELDPGGRIAQRSPFTQDFWVELLCTYRLIFGQHSKRTHKLYKNNDPSSVSLAGRDPLLDDLCGKPSKGNKHLEAVEAFPEKLLYSAESDFPVFGNRLLVLQNYITAQSPNSIKALWYDRRDIHRFWTFWAVIIFGGVSLVLSVIQTVLGGVQVHYAGKEDATQ